MFKKFKGFALDGCEMSSHRMGDHHRSGPTGREWLYRGLAIRIYDGQAGFELVTSPGTPESHFRNSDECVEALNYWATKNNLDLKFSAVYDEYVLKDISLSSRLHRILIRGDEPTVEVKIGSQEWSDWEMLCEMGLASATFSTIGSKGYALSPAGLAAAKVMRDLTSY